jgi:hypothetical protein
VERHVSRLMPVMRYRGILGLLKIRKEGGWEDEKHRDETGLAEWFRSVNEEDVKDELP